MPSPSNLQFWSLAVCSDQKLEAGRPGNEGSLYGTASVYQPTLDVY